MTVTYNTVKEVYGRNNFLFIQEKELPTVASTGYAQIRTKDNDINYGSERLYKRRFCNSLLYTEGVMDFQKTLNSYWVVDNVVSYMPKVLQAYKENEFTFFVVEIALNQEQQGYMEVYTEDYLNGEYHEHISIIKQNLSFIDLPVKVDEEITSYKFFLELSAIEPVTYTLLLTSEH